MPRKKSTKVVSASLDPRSPGSLALFSVYGHELGAVLAAEEVGGGMTNPTFGADFVGVEHQRRAGRARCTVEAIGHQFVRVLGAKARIKRVAPPAGRADHSLGKGTGAVAVHQLCAVTNAKPVPGRVLREAHRATLQGARFGLRARSRPGRRPSVRLRAGPPAVSRVSSPPPASSSYLGRYDERDGEDQQGGDRPAHLRIVQDRSSSGPQKGSSPPLTQTTKKPGRPQHPGFFC